MKCFSWRVLLRGVAQNDRVLIWQLKHRVCGRTNSSCCCCHETVKKHNILDATTVGCYDIFSVAQEYLHHIRRSEYQECREGFKSIVFTMPRCLSWRRKFLMNLLYILWLSVNISNDFIVDQYNYCLSSSSRNPGARMADFVFGLINCHIYFTAFWIDLHLKNGNVTDVAGKYSVLPSSRHSSTMKN
jgi:hypothetical protein